MPSKLKDGQKFWESKSLGEMDEAEWEALCDGCGRCCLYVLHNDETGDVFETDVACRLFDAKKRRCTDYGNRHARVPDCVRVTADNVGSLSWMPETCAYRRLANGQGLPNWHPLITGRRESVVEAGIAVSENLISENEVDGDALEKRITKAR